MIAKRETNAREVGEGPTKDKHWEHRQDQAKCCIHRDWRRDCLCAEAYVFSIPNVYVFYKQVIEWGRVVQVQVDAGTPCELTAIVALGLQTPGVECHSQCYSQVTSQILHTYLLQLASHICHAAQCIHTQTRIMIF